jgi:diguanylate cyclase (GGDEF)-like protein
VTHAVFRVGGEEFAIVLHDGDRANALDVAERLRRAVATRCVDGGAITISLGVACCDPRVTVLDAVSSAADDALYRAKAEGKNCVRASAE